MIANSRQHFGLLKLAVLCIIGMILAGCSLFSEQIRLLPPEDNKMPAWEDPWQSVHFVADESTKTIEPKQLYNLIQNKTENNWWGQADIVNESRQLPDGSVLVVGRVEDYMAPSWVFLFSSTGSFIREYPIGNVPEFLGYSDGFAYISSRFGDGGGFFERVYAINLKNSELVKIYDYDSEYASMINPQPSFFPSNCTKINISDEKLFIDVQDIVRENNWDLSEVIIGAPCLINESYRLVPLAIPKRYKYGVALFNKNYIKDVKLFTETGSLVFPPIYYQGSENEVNLLHSIASSNGGSDLFSQVHFTTRGYLDLQLDTGSVNISNTASFCRIHSCPVGLERAFN